MTKVWLPGDVKGGFPPFAAPPFSINYNGTTYNFGDIATDYGPAIAFIPLVAILEAISIGKAFCKLLKSKLTPLD